MEKWKNHLLTSCNCVLKEFAQKNIHNVFPLHYSPFLKKEKNPTKVYIELFARTWLGISPLLNKNNHEIDNLAFNALDSFFSGYIDFKKADNVQVGNQLMVEMANIVISFLRNHDLWNIVNDTTKKNICQTLLYTSKLTPHSNNWILFKIVIDIFLYDKKYINNIHPTLVLLNNFEKNFYVGDGWYRDGVIFHMDYYNSFVILPFLYDIYKYLNSHFSEQKYKTKYYETILKLQRHSEFLERIIAQDGTFPLFGRSMVYRCAVFHALVYCAYLHLLPNTLSYGQVRCALDKVVDNLFNENIYNKEGFIQYGFTGFQPEIADSYSNSGSVYYTLLIFMVCGLNENHMFWSDSDKDWSQKKIWNNGVLLKDVSLNIF